MSRTTPTPPVFGEDDDDAFEELGREATEWVSFGMDESGTNEGGVREDDDFDGLNLNADVDADKHKDTSTTTMRENVVETTMASPSSSSSPSASSVRRLTAECARLRELLDDAEANALAAVSALDRERVEWKIERVRAQKLVRAAMVGDDDDSGDDDDGANIATRVVFAFANCGKTPRRAELDAFVARARERVNDPRRMKKTLVAVVVDCESRWRKPRRCVRISESWMPRCKVQSLSRRRARRCWRKRKPSSKRPRDG
jgi:hypothetical protein